MKQYCGGIYCWLVLAVTFKVSLGPKLKLFLWFVLSLNEMEENVILFAEWISVTFWICIHLTVRTEQSKFGLPPFYFTVQKNVYNLVIYARFKLYFLTNYCSNVLPVVIYLLRMSKLKSVPDDDLTHLRLGMY